jgi:hypothetical protein
VRLSFEERHNLPEFSSILSFSIPIPKKSYSKL